VADKPFFLSYSHDDAVQVEAVAEELRKRELDVWLDRDKIAVSDSIVGEIDAGIQAAKYFVLFISRSYLAKDWTMLEYRAAMYTAVGARERSVIAVRLGNVELPALIAHRRYVTFQSPPQVADELAQLVMADLGLAPQQRSPSTMESTEKRVSWEGLSDDLIDTILNELLSQLGALRLRANTSTAPSLPLKVQLSDSQTVLVRISKAILNNRQLVAEISNERDILWDTQKAADYNRKLLRRNGLGVFTGAFELDLEDKQNAIDESRKKIREWMALMSPEIWLGE
jgi:hypothetical protein